MNRGQFLRNLALGAGGLLVGEQLLDALAEQPLRRLFTGFGAGTRDVYITTGFSRGMFATYVKVNGVIGTVRIDGRPAHVESVGNGWVRASRFLGAGTPAVATADQIAVRGGSIRMAQLEEGYFPSSFIPTAHVPATRAADNLVIPFTPVLEGKQEMRPRRDWSFARATPAVETRNGQLVLRAAGELRDAHYIGAVRTTLLEGKRTNYLLRQALSTLE